MKKRIVILLLVLIMSVLILPVTGYAESYGGEEIYVSFERAEAENISYAFPKNQSLKSVDVFVGETLDITTALKTPFSADPDGEHTLEYITESGGISVEKKSSSVSETPYRRIVKDTVAVSGLSLGSYDLAAVYDADGREYFDGITVNVMPKEAKTLTLSTSTNSLTKGSKIDFILTIDSSPTLYVPESEIDVSVNGVKIDSLKGYEIGNVDILDVKLECLGKELRKTFAVKEQTPLTSLEFEKDVYSFLLSDKRGTIVVYANKDARPDVVLTSKSDCIAVSAVTSVTSDREGFDRYDVSVEFNSEAVGETVMLRAGDTVRFGAVNIIGKVESVAVRSENSSFSVKETSIFHAVINGIADVDTEVIWSVNGVELDEKSSTVTVRNKYAGDVTVKADVGDISGEYSYTIDVSKGQIILTVILCVAVIALCLPIIFLLKKSPKTDPKETIIKDNTVIISDLMTLRRSIEEKPAEKNVKLVTKILIAIARSEKKCTEEAYESTNKSFLSAADAAKEAKAIADRLPHILKNSKNEDAIAAIDSIISSLKSCNVIIGKVIENS